MDLILWITLLTPSAADGLLAALVRRGYQVGLLGGPDYPSASEDNDVGYFMGITLTLDTDDSEQDTVDRVSDDIDTTLNSTPVRFLSYALVEHPDSLVYVWRGGNVQRDTAIPETVTESGHGTKSSWERLRRGTDS